MSPLGLDERGNLRTTQAVIPYSVSLEGEAIFDEIQKKILDYICKETMYVFFYCGKYT